MKLDVAHTEGDVDVNDIGKKVVDIALSTYVMVDKVNDFFLLHGVTSAWSVLQLLPVLSTDHSLEVLEVYIIVLMATVQNCQEHLNRIHVLIQNSGMRSLRGHCQTQEETNIPTSWFRWQMICGN